MTEVSLTATADRQLRALRGNRRKAALRVMVEVETRGCQAGGYRLTGDHLDVYGTLVEALGVAPSEAADETSVLRGGRWPSAGR